MRHPTPLGAPGEGTAHSCPGGAWAAQFTPLPPTPTSPIPQPLESLRPCPLWGWHQDVPFPSPWHSRCADCRGLGWQRPTAEPAACQARRGRRRWPACRMWDSGVRSRAEAFVRGRARGGGEAVGV